MRSYGYLYSEGGRDRSERNDCTVRALALTFDIPYKEAHECLKRFGRVRFGGVSIDEFEGAIKLACWTKGHMFTKVPYNYPFWFKTNCRITPERFCYDNPSGRFILNMAEHISVCIDGVIYDTNTHWRKLIYSYYTIK